MQPEALDISRWQDDGGACALDNRTCPLTTEMTWLIKRFVDPNGASSTAHTCQRELTPESHGPLAIARASAKRSTRG